jgi:hypothetical protein
MSTDNEKHKKRSREDDLERTNNKRVVDAKNVEKNIHQQIQSQETTSRSSQENTLRSSQENTLKSSQENTLRSKEPESSSVRNIFTNNVSGFTTYTNYYPWNPYNSHSAFSPFVTPGITSGFTPSTSLYNHPHYSSNKLPSISSLLMPFSSPHLIPVASPHMTSFTSTNISQDYNEDISLGEQQDLFQKIINANTTNIITINQLQNNYDDLVRDKWILISQFKKALELQEKIERLVDPQVVLANSNLNPKEPNGKDNLHNLDVTKIFSEIKRLLDCQTSSFKKDLNKMIFSLRTQLMIASDDLKIELGQKYSTSKKSDHPNTTNNSNTDHSYAAKPDNATNDSTNELNTDHPNNLSHAENIDRTKVYIINDALSSDINREKYSTIIQNNSTTINSLLGTQTIFREDSRIGSRVNALPGIIEVEDNKEDYLKKICGKLKSELGKKACIFNKKLLFTNRSLIDDLYDIYAKTIIVQNKEYYVVYFDRKITNNETQDKNDKKIQKNFVKLFKGKGYKFSDPEEFKYYVVQKKLEDNHIFKLKDIEFNACKKKEPNTQ